MSDLRAKAEAYFMDARSFLVAFSADPRKSIAALEADPRAYGLRRPELSAIERDKRLRSLLAAARREAST
jgi:hypothetical protein